MKVVGRIRPMLGTTETARIQFRCSITLVANNQRSTSVYIENQTMTNLFHANVHALLPAGAQPKYLCSEQYCTFVHTNIYNYL